MAQDHAYGEGEKVLCFEPMLGRARILYEAKVGLCLWSNMSDVLLSTCT